MTLTHRRFRAADIPEKLAALARVALRLRLLRRPLGLLMCYLRQSSPACAELRSGLRVRFSSHPHDIVTFFVVFLKRDYGRVSPGSVVFDVGANIGAFALYAAASGARKVYAFEPCEEAFATLCKNVRANGLDGVVTPVRCAVGAEHGGRARFARRSSPYNRLGGEEAAEGGFDEVRTASLGGLMRELGVERVDLLKMDCEGAEFDALPALSPEDAARVGEIRLECHGDPRPLLDSLIPRGFALRLRRAKTVWLAR